MSINKPSKSLLVFVSEFQGSLKQPRIHANWKEHCTLCSAQPFGERAWQSKMLKLYRLRDFPANKLACCRWVLFVVSKSARSIKAVELGNPSRTTLLVRFPTHHAAPLLQVPLLRNLWAMWH